MPEEVAVIPKIQAGRPVLKRLRMIVRDYEGQPGFKLFLMYADDGWNVSHCSHILDVGQYDADEAEIMWNEMYEKSESVLNDMRHGRGDINFKLEKLMTNAELEKWSRT